MSFLAQSDFSALGLAVGQIADCQPLDTVHGLTTVERPRSFDSLKSGSTCEADEITSINSFPDEVYELIRTWELAFHKNQAIHRESGSMEMEMLTDSQGKGTKFCLIDCLIFA